MFRKGKSPFGSSPGSPPESRNSLRYKTKPQYGGNIVAADGRRDNEIPSSGWGLIGSILAEMPPQSPPRLSPVSSFSPPTDQASSLSIQSPHYPEYVEGQLDDQRRPTQSIHSQTPNILLPRRHYPQPPISENKDREKETPGNPSPLALPFHSPPTFPSIVPSVDQVAQTGPQVVIQEESSKVERPALPPLPTYSTPRAATFVQKNKLHPKNQSNLPTSIPHEYETSDNVHSSLAEERSVVELENKSLRGNNEALREQLIQQQSALLTSIRQKHAISEQTNAKLFKEKSVLETENKSLWNDTEALREKIHSLLDELNHLKHKMAALAETTGKDLDKKERDQQQLLNSLRADLIALRSDNNELRKYIAQKETEQQYSLRNQQDFIQQFQELKTILEMYIVKHSKSSAAIELSRSQEIELLKLLTNFGKSGKKSAEFLKKSLQNLYANTRSRILLIRHIVAVFLIDQVFEPFAAGLPSSLSQAICGLVISNESTEEGTSRLLESYFKQREESTGFAMANIFRVVFPRASDEDIKKTTSKFTSKAISFKIAMTKVPGYHCYWVNGRKQFDTNSMEIADDQFGSVYFCTFPGLARTIKVKGKADGNHVLTEVKATVVLRSVFGEDENEDNLAEESADSLSDESEDDLRDDNADNENENNLAEENMDDLSDENEDDLSDENEDELSDENEDNLSVENEANLSDDDAEHIISGKSINS